MDSLYPNLHHTRPWWTGWVQCRICSDRHVSVIQVDDHGCVPEDQECPTCGNMSCDPEEVD